MGSVEKGLGFLIESFSEFLQRVFEVNSGANTVKSFFRSLPWSEIQIPEIADYHNVFGHKKSQPTNGKFALNFGVV